jgi:hypothetical protein
MGGSQKDVDSPHTDARVRSGWRRRNGERHDVDAAVWLCVVAVAMVAIYLMYLVFTRLLAT